MMTLQELQTQIENWHVDRGIPVSSDKAFQKLVEEVGELAEANVSGDPDDLQDAIGDVFVTLVGVAMAHDLSLDECVDYAWQQIKDRTGSVKDGVFEKDSD